MMSGKLLCVWTVLVLIGSVNFVHSAAQEDHIVDLDNNIINVDFEKTTFNPKYEYKLKKIIDDKIQAGKNDEEIQLIIETDVFSENYIDSLEEQGVIVEKTYRNLVQVKVKVRDVENIVKNDFIKRIRTPIVAYPDVVSEGVGVIGADALHALSITGEGVKIAILDGSFLGYGALLGTELPSSVVTRSFHGGGIEAGGSHGTACAEIVHDVAPGASLYLVNFDSLGFYQAMNWLIAEGVDIISFSMSFFLAGPGDGTGLICEKVDEAASAGILFVTSAGNYATSHYEGYFQSGGGLAEWHDFDIGDETIDITANAGEVIRIYMSWSATWPTVEDYNLFLLDSGMNFVASSENLQYPGGNYPVESIYYAVPASGVYHIAVWKYSTTSDWDLEIFCPSHDLDEHQVASGSVSTPTDAYGAFSVGATYWGDDILEYFSSWGPTNDGRVKPDVCAPDGVSTDTYTTFFGTSASAPHVAGAAALLLSYHPSLTVAQITSSLEDGSFDLGATGRDNLYGEGRIDVYESYVDIKYDVTLPVDFGTVIAGETYIQTDVITASGVGNTITVTAAAQASGTLNALEELRYVAGTVTGASGVPLTIWNENTPVSSWTAITLDAGEQLSLEAYAGLAPGTWGSIVITLTVN